MIRSKGLLLLLPLLGLGACRANRPEVEIQTDPTRDSSLTDTSRVKSELKITAISTPPQAFSYDRLELTVEDSDQAGRGQQLDDYKLNTSLPIKANKTYYLRVRAFSGQELLYSSEYCKSKRSFRSQLGTTLLTVSLCEKADESEADDPTDDPPS